MNNKITFQEFASLLADTAGVTKKNCEDFLREFINVVSEGLAQGENIKIKGFGTFKLVEVDERKSVNIATGEEIKIPIHYKATFVSAKEFSNAVNSPFAIFETMEISDDVKDSELNSISEDTILELTECAESSLVESSEHIEEENSKLEEESLIEDGGVLEIDEETSENELGAGKKSRFGIGFLWGFLCAVVIAVIGILSIFYFFSQHNPFLENKDSAVAITTIEENRVVTDSSSEVEILEEDVNTAPSDEVIYDTISTTRFLTTMAKEYYGNYNLWPYIYEENKAFLGHPDRIKPGTKVIIPPLSKYGVNPNDPAEIEKAKKLGLEIYAKYKK